MSLDPTVQVTFPTREEAVLRNLVSRWAAEQPDKEFVLFDGDVTWTYADMATQVWGLASVLTERFGVEVGDIVASWLPNGPEALASWFATNCAGAVYAPLNTAYRGTILEHALNLTQAKVLVLRSELLERLDGLELPYVKQVVVVGDLPESTQPFDVVGWDEVAAERRDAPPALAREIEAWDDMTVMLTSGTTGASKAVRRTYAQYAQYTRTNFLLVGIHAEDRFFACGPMFHGGTDTPIFGVLQIGGSMAIVDGFSASRFWSQIRNFNCTVSWIYSAMSLFLSKQPPCPDDTDNPLRLGMFAPLFPGFEELAARHEFRVYMVYGMTEIACPFSWLDPDDYRSLGEQADPGFELRLVNEHDIDVAEGTPGEMIVRHTLPWVLSPGYLNDPAATAKAWRNGWFHTGDVFVRESSGRYRLVDRVKDSIRRRGENVSSAEVEAELLKHSDIRESAVIGVKAEMEEEVLAYVVGQPDRVLDPTAIHEFLRERLPYYAVPRYLKVVDSLPRSAVLRVDKPSLRQLGIPDGVWDADEAGVAARKEKFAPR